MVKPKNPIVRPEPALLITPREEARAQLIYRYELGEEIMIRDIPNSEALGWAKEDYTRWSAYNEELVRRMFSNEEYASSYRSASRVGVMVMGEPSFHTMVQNHRDQTSKKINMLKSLAERLDLIAEVPVVSSRTSLLGRPSMDMATNNKVFLVHGQDDEAKSIVARFVERCGLKAVILHEQADLGRTIIEKFEQEADVGFAIILLTPDDVGGLRDAGDVLSSKALKARARQNVVLELGYFLGRLGRSRVCALRKGDTELPSDISGVVYTPLGADDGWKMKLARELKAAGYEIDLNKALD